MVFLKRSAKLAQGDGFIDNASVDAAAADPSIFMGQTSSSTALQAPSYPSIENIHGLVSGFLQMQPETVSAAALLELDDDATPFQCVIGLALFYQPGGCSFANLVIL